MTKQKLRSEIDVLDTWDLTLIFKNDDEFYSFLSKTKKYIKRVSKYKGKILESSETLYEFLDFSDKLERKLYRLYYYAHLKLDQDTTNTFYQELEGKVTNLLYDYSCLTTFVTPEMMKGNYKLVKKYIKENKNLLKYKFNLESFYRYQKHSLNDSEENIMSTLSKSIGNNALIFENLTNADITFGNILVDGKEVELTESNYSNFIRSNDRNLRKDAFNKFLTTYSNYKNTLASTFSGNVETLVGMAKIKKFKSSIEASLFGDNIDVSVYDNLIKKVKENLNVLYKYYDLKKNVLNVDELHLYDVYAPLTVNYDKKYTFIEAKDTVIKALSVLGDEYINNLKKAFDERWIDIYNNKGKRTGAYSSGFYDTKPYLLLNFEGKYEDVTTLVHELGHSMHTYYSCKNNPYNLSSYNIFVAEVASTVNELLLVRYLLKESKDVNEKLFLLNQLMELYRATIYRQVMFAEFERNMHKDLSNGNILTHEYLSNHYYDLVKEYFGPRVICDDLIKYEWERIPHFYYDFYVYKYAIGLSCASKIVDDILSGKKDSVNDYMKFLKSGGSNYPKDELLLANVNILDENVYLNAIKAFDEYISLFSEIREK